MALELDKFDPAAATPLEIAQLWDRHQEIMRSLVALSLRIRQLERIKAVAQRVCNATDVQEQDTARLNLRALLDADENIKY